jgi:hypothetical protein
MSGSSTPSSSIRFRMTISERSIASARASRDHGALGIVDFEDQVHPALEIEAQLQRGARFGPGSDRGTSRRSRAQRGLRRCLPRRDLNMTSALRDARGNTDRWRPHPDDKLRRGSRGVNSHSAERVPPTNVGLTSPPHRWCQRSMACRAASLPSGVRRSASPSLPNHEAIPLRSRPRAGR